MSVICGGDIEPSDDNCGSKAMEPIVTAAKDAWSRNEGRATVRRGNRSRKPHRRNGKVRNEGPNLRPAIHYQRGTVDVDLVSASYLR